MATSEEVALNESDDDYTTQSKPSGRDSTLWFKLAAVSSASSDPRYNRM